MADLARLERAVASCGWNDLLVRKPKKILALLGAPHYVRNAGVSADWEYDVSLQGEAWTLRLSWDLRRSSPKLVELKEIAPGWRDPLRAKELFLWY